VGNAMCEQYAPNTFGLNEERQSYVKDPAGDPVEMVIEAATNCPVSAIKVEDADTGEVLFVEENFQTAYLLFENRRGYGNGDQ